jgi:predicted enzyme related to lactoylglutathione lyase
VGPHESRVARVLKSILRSGDSADASHLNEVASIKVIELAFCCYAVTDMKRAREFYEGVLNLQPTTVTDTEHGQWTEYEFGPYALAIGCAAGFKPNPDGCSAALEVEDFDAAVAHLKRHNVKFRIEPLATPVCRMAMIYDLDGNSICVHKRDPGRG